MPFLFFFFTPWLYGQNRDELLVVRLPAKHGSINEPGAAPIPDSTARLHIASRRARMCESMALAVAQRSPVTASQSAAGKCKT
jgi:hypothetical protein